MPPSIVRCEYGPENFVGVGTRFRMGRAVGVTLERDRGHGDDGALGEPLLELVVLGLAVGQPEPPAVVVDHDRDVIGVVERRRAAVEGGVVEVPLRRGGPPDQPRELAPVLLVAGTAALGGEVVLVPPLQLGLRRQRHPAGCLAADQVAAHRDQRRCSAPARARRRCRRFARPSRSRRRSPSRSRARPSGRSRRPRAPPARRCGTVSSDRKRVVP